jgi:multidrug efflux system membrane fusion protein
MFWQYRLVRFVCCSLLVIGCAAGIGCRSERLAPQAPPPPVVSVARPVVYSVQSYYEYNGNLDSVEMVQVTARVQGILNEVAFKEGDEVEPKALLFKIDPREYVAAVKKADADRLKATVEVKHAKMEETRAVNFRGTGAISEEEYEQRVAARETAEAVLMQTEAALEAGKLQLEYTEIRSPIAGQISRTRVTRGNLVGQDNNTVLTTIVSMDPLYIWFDAPERDLVEYQRQLQAGEKPESDLLSGSIPVEIGVTSESGFPHVGQIDFRENRVDVGTGTVRIRGRIPNPRVPPGNARVLYPGLYARVRVPSGPPRSLPSIPEDALMTGQEGYYVYVLGDGNVIQKRTVKVGPTVWKSQGIPNDPAQWTIVPSRPADAKLDAPQSIAVPSVVSVEEGLTINDVLLINGLTKARPGNPVSPESWELRPPAQNEAPEKAAPGKAAASQ